jgi:hypothetical protein
MHVEAGGAAQRFHGEISRQVLSQTGIQHLAL